MAASLAVGLALYYHLRKRKQRRRKIVSEQLNEEDLHEYILPLLPIRFSYKALCAATGGFSKLLGAGGCGSVYAGMLPDGRKVAIKMLNCNSKGQLEEFSAEVATIGRTNHVNIVRLLGFCWEVSHRLLVYEYAERGSLDHWLFSNANGNGVDDSMGMVMLEIVGGTKNVDLPRLSNALDLAGRQAWHFPSWAADKCEQGLMMEIVDKRLQVCGFDEEQVRTLIYTAFCCIQDDPELRPYASTVVQWLEGRSPVTQPPFIMLNAQSHSHSHFLSNSVAT